MKSNDAMEKAKEQALRFGKFLMDHWITVVILGVSSTQTYFLVSRFAPEWAFWLPALGVCLMEGGYLYWRWREYEADPLETESDNKQETIANVMVYLTLGSSVLTMLAGATIEIANSDMAYLLTIPNMDVYLGLAAVVCIFLLAGAHLFADWQYRRNDPDAELERDFRLKKRKLTRDLREANIEGEKIVAQGRNEELKRLYNEHGNRMGVIDATEEFDKIKNPTKGNGK